MKPTKKARSRKYPSGTMTDADYSVDQVLPANTLDQAKSIITWSMKQKALASMWTKIKQFMCGRPIKLVDQFTYIGTNISSIESDVNIGPAKAWTVIDMLLILWKFVLSDKMKRDFFQTEDVSRLLNGCSTRTLTWCLKKKLDWNYTRILRAVLNKFWR